MSSGQQAIASLLEAEQKAAAQIAAAKVERKESLQKAKADAQAEVEAFRAELQKTYEAENSTSTGAKDDTEAKSRQICAKYQQQYQQNKAAAQNLIMTYAVDVKLQAA